MKKIVCLILAAVLLLGTAAASADRIQVDGLTDRNIKINRAGLNASAEEVIATGYSPTTGRNLAEIEVPDGFLGVAVTGTYQPIMVQITNSGNGVGVSENGKMYVTAPVNGAYPDVVYESIQKQGGGESRMSMIFSDTIPDYVGYVRSTRVTHLRIRQEWECALCTSGYSSNDVPDEIRKLGVKNPAGKDRTAEDPGIMYVGDYPKVWKEYVWRLYGKAGPNNELFQLANIAQNIIPKDHVPANHTWLFSDELPEGGDDAEIVYVTFGNQYESNSRLEYDPESNSYYRYVSVRNSPDVVYTSAKLINPVIRTVSDSDGDKVKKVVAEDRVLDQPITFTNIIVQGIHMHWIGSVRPDPRLVGSGNADYFMGGKHYAGVWERTDINNRTVFYGEDGNEISLQRGRTLIILMPYEESSGNSTYASKHSKLEYE